MIWLILWPVGMALAWAFIYAATKGDYDDE